MTGFVMLSFSYKAEIVIENTVPDFSLRNVDGKIISLKDFQKAKGFIIVFTCNHCPFAKLYTQRLNDLNKKYKSLGVPLLAINSMDTSVYEDESFSNMKSKSVAEKFNFPYLHDATQVVGKNFGADHTPHAYVIWKENNEWKIKYSGAIDNNGEEPKKAVPFIANAVNELLENKQVSNSVTLSVGCKIFYRK
ncbi:MAG: thioredoxin family protein [Bacteroidota bacterium]